MKHPKVVVAALFVAPLLGTPVHAQIAAPNDAGVAFGHVHLHVADVDLHGHLLTELFDATLKEKAGYTAVEIPGALIFLTADEPTAPSRATAMDHFALEVRDLDAVLAAWRDLGYEVDAGGPAEAHEPADAARRAFITLPDGAGLEIQENPALGVTARMDHVHFFTPESEELVSWYAALFGTTSAEPDAEETTTTVPGSGLVFTSSEQERAPTEGTAIDHVGFEVENMEAFAEMLRAEDVEFVWGPAHIESLDIWVAFFNDPSGVLVEVTERLDTF